MNPLFNDTLGFIYCRLNCEVHPGGSDSSSRLASRKMKLQPKSLSRLRAKGHTSLAAKYFISALNINLLVRCSYILNCSVVCSIWLRRRYSSCIIVVPPYMCLMDPYWEMVISMCSQISFGESNFALLIDARI